MCVSAAGRGRVFRLAALDFSIREKAEPSRPPFGFAALDRDVFVDHTARRFYVVRQGLNGACTEKLHTECNNLGAILLRFSIAGLPRSRPHAPFDAHLATLSKYFAQVSAISLPMLRKSSRTATAPPSRWKTFSHGLEVRASGPSREVEC
jgi:hypothetical protein